MPFLARMMFASAVLVLCLAGWSQVRSESDKVFSEAPAQADSTEGGQATELKTGRTVALVPAVFSTPETGFGGGAGLLVTYRNPKAGIEERPQSLGFFGILTAKGQASVAVAPELYFRRGTWRLTGSVGYQKFPTTFFGVGNATADDEEEEYTLEGAAAGVSVLRTLRGSFHFGLGATVAGRSIQAVEPDGLLDRELLAGHDGGFYAGLGPIIDWDRRDNTFSPTTGEWLRFETLFHTSRLGSDADFRFYRANLRRYQSMGRSIVLATQLILSSRDGKVPFHDLARLGDVMRGISEARVIDRTLLAAQAEVRFPIRGRFGGVAFGSAGDVADGLDRYRISTIKFAGGTGLRFALNKVERINIRIDFGFSEFGSEVYFQFSEAF